MPKKPLARPRDKSALSVALDHVELCCHGPSNYAPYCAFTPGWLIGYDGVIAAGYRVREELPSAPHTETFRTAVARAGEPFSLTVMPDGTVTVRGHHFKASVPTFPLDKMHNAQPDPPQFEVTEGFRVALVAVAKITSNRTDRVVGASALLKRMSAVATDGGTILEAHHGGNFPGEWLLPREFVEALGKVKYQPTHAGWSDTTFTVWFGPNAWLRTNFYQESYPDTDMIFAGMLSQGVEYRPVPDVLLLALETLKPFLTPEKVVTFTETALFVTDGKLAEGGASYALAHNFTTMRALPWEGLRYAATHGQWLTFNPDGFYWYGQTLRGATAARAA